MHDVNSATPTGAQNSSIHPINYTQFEQEPQFQNLRKRQRSFVFPMAAFFLAWYFAFVIFAAYAPEVMATPIFGDVNLGLLLGLAQFVTTFVITMWYVRFANSKLDPAAAALRQELAALEAGVTGPADSTTAFLPTATQTQTPTATAKFETEGADRA